MGGWRYRGEYLSYKKYSDHHKTLVENHCCYLIVAIQHRFISYFFKLLSAFELKFKWSLVPGSVEKCLRVLRHVTEGSYVSRSSWCSLQSMLLLKVSYIEAPRDFTEGELVFGASGHYLVTCEANHSYRFSPTVRIMGNPSMTFPTGSTTHS